MSSRIFDAKEGGVCIYNICIYINIYRVKRERERERAAAAEEGGGSTMLLQTAYSTVTVMESKENRLVL